MSRTVHHVRYKHRDSTKTKHATQAEIVESGGNWVRYHQLFTTMEWHSLYGLRYSAAALAKAERGGHRPRPESRRHRLEAYTYPRTYNVRVVGGISNRQERALRAADRAWDRKARQVLRGSQDATEDAWDVEFPDPRHRHYGVWDSW
jgi:hypothetical protein